MNTNELQRKIANIEGKLNLIGITNYYDSDYNFIIEYNSTEKKAYFVSNQEELNNLHNCQKDYIIINLSSDELKSLYNTISSDDIDKLIYLKSNLDKNIFAKIVEYVFFNKANKVLFDILDLLGKRENGKKKDENIENVNDYNEKIIKILNDEFKSEEPFKKKKGKKYYVSNTKKIAVLAMTSKRYNNTSYKYWFTFHKYQKEFLQEYEFSYVMLYFIDKMECVMIEAQKLYKYLDKMNKTVHGDNIGWHLHVQEVDGKYRLRIPKEGTIQLNNNYNNTELKSTNSLKLSLKDYKVVKMK